MDSAESDQNGFFYFVKALEILSMDAERQCDVMGSYNTPWEIQHDVADFAYLADSPALALTHDQQIAVKDLSEALLALPQSAIAPEGMKMTTPAGCIAGMRHPAWEPVREGAKKLLALLAPVILENRRYLHLP